MHMDGGSSAESPRVQHQRGADVGAQVLGSAAIRSSVSVMSNSSPYSAALFWYAMSAMGTGSVKTTW